MGIKISRFEQNWKLSIEEKWRVLCYEDFEDVVELLNNEGLKFSVSYPALPNNEVKDIMIREDKVYRDLKKIKALFDRILSMKDNYGVVF